MGEPDGRMALKGETNPMLTLRDLVEREGWRYVEVDAPSEEPSRLGSPQRDPLCFAQACAGNVLAVKPNGSSHAFYAAAHEIAEARHDFSGHDQHVWREQCNILARWCRQLYQAQLPRAEPAVVTIGSEDGPDLALIGAFVP